jgi:hypothetical protein
MTESMQLQTRSRITSGFASEVPSVVVLISRGCRASIPLIALPRRSKREVRTAEVPISIERMKGDSAWLGVMEGIVR